MQSSIWIFIQIAKETLPRGYDIECSGVTREEKESGGQTLITFAICLLFVYLLLAAFIYY